MAEIISVTRKRFALDSRSEKSVNKPSRLLVFGGRVMQSRAQGRPCRGESQVGRVGIVEGVRSVLRSGKCSDVSRKSLAFHIGVTPALITYYFPKRESLMEEVVVPVVRDYRVRLGQIAESYGEPEEKLRQIIGLLSKLYGNDAMILAIYRTLEDAAPDDARELAVMTRILSDFFFAWRGDERARSFDAAVLQGAVRGMCEFAKRARAGDCTSAPDRDDEAELDWLEPLHRMLIVGRDIFVGQPGRNLVATAN